MTKKMSRRSFVQAGSFGAGALMAGSVASTKAASDVSKKSSTLPALLGGERAHKNGWPHWPHWNPADDREIAAVMKNGVWSRSKLVTEFENQWAKLIGAECCLAVVNGTNALSASFMELDIRPGDEVIISPYTFSASIFGVLYKGAMPVFADIDPETYQIDPKQILNKITPKTKAILPVHICGIPSDMETIAKIAKERNLFIVEDCCQAHLTAIRGKNLGTFGNAGCFSFQTSKVMPIGEGGAIVTSDPDFKDRLYSYHNYGYASKILPGTYSSTIHSYRLGNKIRMAEYQAAIGLCQLKKFKRQNEIRNENGARLRKRLAAIPGITPVRLYDGVSNVSWYMCPFIFDSAKFKGLTRNQFVRALGAEGVLVSGGYPNDPLYTQGLIGTTLASDIYKQFYSPEQLNFEAYKERNACPKLLQTFESSVWLSSTNMFLGSASDVDDIANAVEKIYEHAEKLKDVK